MARNTTGETTVVLVCTCGGTLLSTKAAESVVERLQFSAVENVEVIVDDKTCGVSQPEGLAKIAQKRRPGSILFAGCSAARNRETLDGLARSVGLPPNAVQSADVRPHALLPADGQGIAGEENRIKATVSSIMKGIKAIREIPELSLKTLPLTQAVLVLGGGTTGAHAAAEAAGYGYETVLVSGDSQAEISPAGSDTLSNVTLRPESELVALDGGIGKFTATLRGPEGSESKEFGAIILSPGRREQSAGADRIRRSFASDSIVPLGELAEKATALPRVSEVRSIGIVLDMEIDETKASTEKACSTALLLQKPDAVQTYIFCRDARVGSLFLEKAYDDARDAGVHMVKYDGKISITADGDRVTVGCKDAVLETPIQVECDLVGVSPDGVAVNVDPAIAEVTGVNLDSFGQLQDNNIHLLPVLTNLPGVFVAGPGRGQHYLPQALDEAKAAALEAHLLLSQGTLEVELSEAKVDPDKCALCLTCIRACPHGAMRVDRSEGIAECVPEICRRCGICAGECPAKAIELPVYTDAGVLAQL